MEAGAIPYVALLEGRDPVEVMAGTPARLAELFAALTSEQIEQRPSPGKWSLCEVMAHLADCEIAWSWRLRQVFGEDNPVLQPFEQDAWAKAYPGYTFAQARATWQGLRAWNVDFLANLTEEQKRRPAIHREHGPITLWTIAGIAAGHDLHHLHRLAQQLEVYSPTTL